MTTQAPRVEILTIGREILDGRVVDTNSIFIAERLKELGLVPRWGSRVDDEAERVMEAFEIAASRADIVIATGGLGPTSDDLTAELFARFLGEPWVENAAARKVLEDRLSAIGRPMTESQVKQAKLAGSCFVLKNPEGTAPGFGYEGTCGASKRRVSWYFMPGVPREMKPMLVNEVAPRLPRVAGYRTHQWATQFTAEAQLQELLTPLEKTLPTGFEVTYRTRFPENHIGLHADCFDEARTQKFTELTTEITKLLGESCFSQTETGALPALESVVIEKLVARRAGLMTIESCTGGLIASRLTDLPGSSRAYLAGRVVYDNAAKIELGVNPRMLEEFGAVSREVAGELAELGLQKLQAMFPKRTSLYCVATTGIAGPTGGTAEKPVGLCHIALARLDKPTLFEEVRGRPALDRLMLKTLFAQKALDLVRQSLV